MLNNAPFFYILSKIYQNMIIINQSLDKVKLKLVKNSFNSVENYSIIVQNTLTKKYKIFEQCENIACESSIYLEFVLDIEGFEEGEYELIVFENNDRLEFISSANAPKKIETSFIRFLIKDGAFIKNGDYFLVVSENKENTLQYIATEMMRIGDYKTNTTQYNKQQKYIAYEKNN